MKQLISRRSFLKAAGVTAAAASMAIGAPAASACWFGDKSDVTILYTNDVHTYIDKQSPKLTYAAIADLKANGVKKTVMLTGDAKKVADAVAAELGVDEVHSELLPGDKVDEVEKLLARKGKKEVLAFVGDGINDAPVLARSDIGIAMGGVGSDAAIEAADVVIMTDEPSKIAKAIEISKKTLRLVHENVAFILAVKFTVLGLGAVGMASIWAAVFADVGVSVISILNAMRALRFYK